MEHASIQDPIIREMTVNSPIRDRRIFLNDNIDSDSIFKTNYWLDRLMSIDLKTGEKPDIEIVIDSYGGSVYSGLGLVSKIESMIKKGYNIITTVQSVAMSMGFIILIAGSTRRAYKYSRIMHHPMSSGTYGTLQDMIEDIEEAKALDKMMDEMVISQTNIPQEKLNEINKCKQNWFFSGDEALELNVVDELL